MRYIAVFWFFVFILVISVPFGYAGSSSGECGAGEGDPLALFVRGNDFYQKEEFEAALACYKRAGESGMKTGDLHFNMGNAYFKSNRPGLAVLNYKRAQKYMPADADLSQNLQYVQSLVKDKQAEPGLVQKFSGHLMIFNPETTFYLFAAGNLLLWGSVVAWEFWKRRALFCLGAVAACICLFLSPGLFARDWFAARYGVVISLEVPVRSSPDAEGLELFSIHEGLVLTVEAEKDGWLKIATKNKKRGWVRNDDVRRV